MDTAVDSDIAGRRTYLSSQGSSSSHSSERSIVGSTFVAIIDRDLGPSLANPEQRQHNSQSTSIEYCGGPMCDGVHLIHRYLGRLGDGSRSTTRMHTIIFSNATIIIAVAAGSSPATIDFRFIVSRSFSNHMSLLRHRGLSPLSLASVCQGMVDKF